MEVYLETKDKDVGYRYVAHVKHLTGSVEIVYIPASTKDAALELLNNYIRPAQGRILSLEPR
jgi:hypothetical protein